MASDWGKEPAAIWLDLQGALSTIIKTHDPRSESVCPFDPSAVEWLTSLAGTPYPGPTTNRVGGPGDGPILPPAERVHLWSGPLDVYTKVTTLPPTIAPPDREVGGRRTVHALSSDGPVWVPWADLVPYDPALEGEAHGVSGEA